MSSAGDSRLENLFHYLRLARATRRSREIRSRHMRGSLCVIALDNYQDEPMKFDNYVLWTLGGALVLLIAYFLGTTLFKQFRQEADYESRAFHGQLVGLKDVGRGEYLLTIKQEHGDTLSYYLHIKWFIEENNIQPNDSVSKGPNTYAMRFFKKQNGEYVNCCVYGI